MVVVLGRPCQQNLHLLLVAPLLRATSACCLLSAHVSEAQYGAQIVALFLHLKQVLLALNVSKTKNSSMSLFLFFPSQ